jgi:hypothetical protein
MTVRRARRTQLTNARGFTLVELVIDVLVPLMRFTTSHTCLPFFCMLPKPSTCRPFYLDSGVMRFSFSSSFVTTFTSSLIAFIGEPLSNLLVVPVHTSSPSGLAVE